MLWEQGRTEAMKRNPYSPRENVFWFVLGACTMAAVGAASLFVLRIYQQ
jgi:hypothetical protein